MARLFNLREGFGRKDDDFPVRMYEPPRKGPLADKPPLSREQVSQETSAYYEKHGWDADQGIPYAETLEQHGLREYAGFLGGRVPSGRGGAAVAEAPAMKEHVEE